MSNPPPDIPVTASQLRRHNTALVLRTLRDGGPLSRTELAGRTGLAKATVGTIVSELQAYGAVAERSTDARTRGRPSRPVTLDGGRFVALGVDVNVDYIALVALDLSGRMVLVDEVPAAPSPEHVGDAIEAAIGRLRDGGYHLLGVTVAVPGLIGSGERVAYAPNLGWDDLDLVAALRPALGPDVALRIDNDANCGALAEAAHGACRGVDDVLYVTGTVGIGGGIVAGGSVLRGALGFAGEVGHMGVGDPNARCGCGRYGCWEAVVGLRAMLRAVGVDDATGTPLEIGAHVASLAESDPDVREGLAQVSRWLAAGSSVLANTLNPSVIVLGGYFVALGRWLLPDVRRALSDDVFAGPGTRVELSSLGLHAAALGAAARILADVYDARVPLAPARPPR